MAKSEIERIKSKALFDQAKKTIPGGVNSPVRAFEPYPFFASQASGSKLFGVDGESYIDYCMAYGALLFGHANQEVVDAVKAQLSKGSLYGVPTALEVEFSTNSLFNRRRIRFLELKLCFRTS